MICSNRNECEEVNNLCINRLYAKCDVRARSAIAKLNLGGVKYWNHVTAKGHISKTLSILYGQVDINVKSDRRAIH